MFEMQSLFNYYNWYVHFTHQTISLQWFIYMKINVPDKLKIILFNNLIILIMLSSVATMQWALTLYPFSQRVPQKKTRWTFNFMSCSGLFFLYSQTCYYGPCLKWKPALLWKGSLARPWVFPLYWHCFKWKPVTMETFAWSRAFPLKAGLTVLGEYYSAIKLLPTCYLHCHRIFSLWVI